VGLLTFPEKRKKAQCRLSTDKALSSNSSRARMRLLLFAKGMKLNKPKTAKNSSSAFRSA
jgi:hypothetical protein